MITLKNKLLLALALLYFPCKAQTSFNAIARPSVFAGYIFGSGFFGGADISISMLEYTIANQLNYSGLNFSLSMFSGYSGIDHKKGLYKVFAFNYYHNVNDQFNLKLGIVKNVMHWGLDKVNKSAAIGSNFDISFAPIKQNAYIGYRHFGINNRCVGPDIKSGHVVYLNYQYPISSTTFSK